MSKLLLVLLMSVVGIQEATAQCRLDYSNYTPVFTETFDEVDTITQLSPVWKFWYPEDSTYGPYYGWGSEMWSKEGISFLDEGDKKFVRLAARRLPQPVKCGTCADFGKTRQEKKYISGMLRLSAGEDEKQGYTYGIFEASIRLPPEEDAWAAFWMVGAEFTGTVLEIDIIDGYHRNARSWATSLHDWTYGNCGSALAREPRATVDLSGDFHLFSIAWTPQKLTYFLDGRELHTISNPVENKENCPGGPRLLYTHPDKVVLMLTMQMTDWATVENAHMDVDYVKIYKPCIKVAEGCKPPAQLSAYDYNTTSFMNCAAR